MPVSACSSLIRSRIWACVVTSSAVVGSSAMRRAGLRDQRHGDHGALAQAAGQLERIGLEGPLGIWEADPREHLDGALRRPRARSTFGVDRSASVTWSPTVCSGESEVIGSWKIMAMRPPRRSRIALALGVELGDVDGRAGRRGSSKDDRAGDDAGAPSSRMREDRLRGDRLAGAGLADERRPCGLGIGRS